MATGTADVAIMISEELARLQAAAEGTVPGTVQHAVVGIDPSAEMLNVSRPRRSASGPVPPKGLYFVGSEMTPVLMGNCYLNGTLL